MTKYCESCEKIFKTNAYVFCPYCGDKLAKIIVDTPQKIKQPKPKPAWKDVLTDDNGLTAAEKVLGFRW